MVGLSTSCLGKNLLRWPLCRGKSVWWTSPEGLGIGYSYQDFMMHFSNQKLFSITIPLILDFLKARNSLLLCLTHYIFCVITASIIPISRQCFLPFLLMSLTNTDSCRHLFKYPSVCHPSYGALSIQNTQMTGNTFLIGFFFLFFS